MIRCDSCREREALREDRVCARCRYARGLAAAAEQAAAYELEQAEKALGALAGVGRVLAQPGERFVPITHNSNGSAPLTSEMLRAEWRKLAGACPRCGLAGMAHPNGGTWPHRCRTCERCGRRLLHGGCLVCVLS